MTWRMIILMANHLIAVIAMLCLWTQTRLADLQAVENQRGNGSDATKPILYLLLVSPAFQKFGLHLAFIKDLFKLVTCFC